MWCSSEKKVWEFGHRVLGSFIGSSATCQGELNDHEFETWLLPRRLAKNAKTALQNVYNALMSGTQSICFFSVFESSEKIIHEQNIPYLFNHQSITKRTIFFSVQFR